MQASNMSVNFGIRGNELSPDEVTTALEITPTKSWKRGDIYNSRYKDRDGSIKYRQATRPCGIWELSSVAFTKSTVLEDHAVFIYEKLSPSIGQLEKFIDDKRKHC